MKVCDSCKIEKDVSEFYKHRNRPDGLNQSCKVCHSKRMVELNKKKRAKRISLVEEFKKVPCACCGLEFGTYAMQFHHTDPSTKVNEVSQMLMGKLEDLLNEISKCVVVCANCHLGIERGVLNIGEKDA